MSGKEKDGVHEEVVANSGHKITNPLYKWCHCEDSVSSLLAANPNATPKDVWRKLFYDDDSRSSGEEYKPNTKTIPVGDEELRRARLCGKWGSKEPSDLFTRVSIRR